MKLKVIFIVNMLLVAAMLTLSIWAWGQLPFDAQVPVHFDIKGSADEYMGKEGLLVIPLITFLITVMYLILPRIEPKQQNLRRSSKAYTAVSIASAALLCSVHIVIIWSALGRTINVNTVIDVTMGLFLVVMGNYLSKIRCNHFFGIRTPWTLSSDLAWQKTHRLGGWLIVLHGLAFLIAGLLSNTTLFIYLVISLLIVSLVVLPIYSYFIWRSDSDRSTT